MNAAVGEPGVQPVQLNVDDAGEVVGAQRGEHDDLVEPVQELGLERLPHHPHHGLLLEFGLQALVGQVLRTQVAGHDQNHVAKVDRAALTVGEPSVIEHLQQNVEHLGVRLLDLVEQDHRVRTPPHRFGELTALFVADVPGRGADQARDRVLLAVLAHVDAHHRALVVEQKLGQRLGQLGLAHTGRAEEQERSDRTVGVADAGPRTTHRVGDGDDGLALTDQPLAEALLHLQQLLALALQQPADRNAGPRADHLGDVGGRHLFAHHRRPVLLFGLGRFHLCLQARDLAVQNLGRPGQVALALRPLGGDAQFVHPGLELAHPVEA